MGKADDDGVYPQASLHPTTSSKLMANLRLACRWSNFDRKILGIADAKSGHDVDKIKELGLTPVDSNHVDVPGFTELPLTIECKVKYVQDQGSEGCCQRIPGRHVPAGQWISRGEPRLPHRLHG